MSTPENILYDSLIGNTRHTIMLAVNGSLSSIFAMSTNPELPRHIAQLEFHGFQFFITIGEKTVEVIAGKVNFRDMDKAEKRIEIDVQETGFKLFISRLLAEKYSFLTGTYGNEKKLSSLDEIITHIGLSS